MVFSFRTVYTFLSNAVNALCVGSEPDHDSTDLTPLRATRNMHIYKEPFIRNRRRKSVDVNKENVIGQPKLVATTFDEAALQSLPTVTEAQQSASTGMKKPAALAKWKKLEEGAEFPSLSPTRETAPRRPLSEMPSPNARSSEFRYSFMDTHKVLPELPLFASKGGPLQADTAYEQSRPELKVLPFTYVEPASQDSSSPSMQVAARPQKLQESVGLAPTNVRSVAGPLRLAASSLDEAQKPDYIPAQFTEPHPISDSDPQILSKASPSLRKQEAGLIPNALQLSSNPLPETSDSSLGPEHRSLSDESIELGEARYATLPGPVPAWVRGGQGVVGSSSPFTTRTIATSAQASPVTLGVKTKPWANASVFNDSPPLPQPPAPLVQAQGAQASIFAPTPNTQAPLTPPIDHTDLEHPSRWEPPSPSPTISASATVRARPQSITERAIVAATRSISEPQSTSSTNNTLSSTSSAPSQFAPPVEVPRRLSSLAWLTPGTDATSATSHVHGERPVRMARMPTTSLGTSSILNRSRPIPRRMVTMPEPEPEQVARPSTPAEPVPTTVVERPSTPISEEPQADSEPQPEGQPQPTTEDLPSSPPRRAVTPTPTLHDQLATLQHHRHALTVLQRPFVDPRQQSGNVLQRRRDAVKAQELQEELEMCRRREQEIELGIWRREKRRMNGGGEGDLVAGGTALWVRRVFTV